MYSKRLHLYKFFIQGFSMNQLKKWHIFGVVFTIFFGTILHFIYEWLGRDVIAGVFGAINESTWEHLKLLYWPIFSYALVEQWVLGQRYHNIMAGMAIGVLAGMASIISIFYTYTGVIGQNYLWADITTFIISVLISFFIGYQWIRKQKREHTTKQLFAWFVWIGFSILFVVFTFWPPQIGLFIRP